MSEKKSTEKTLLTNFFLGRERGVGEKDLGG